MKRSKKDTSVSKLTKKIRRNYLKQHFFFNKGYEKLNKFDKDFVFNLIKLERAITKKEMGFLKKLVDKYFTNIINGIKVLDVAGDNFFKDTITSKSYRKNKAIGNYFK